MQSCLWGSEEVISSNYDIGRWILKHLDGLEMFRYG